MISSSACDTSTTRAFLGYSSMTNVVAINSSLVRHQQGAFRYDMFYETIRQGVWYDTIRSWLYDTIWGWYVIWYERYGVRYDTISDTRVYSMPWYWTRSRAWRRSMKRVFHVSWLMMLPLVRSFVRSRARYDRFRICDTIRCDVVYDTIRYSIIWYQGIW